MSKQATQAAPATPKPATQSALPCQKSAPMPLDLGQLRQVSGGLPRAGW